VNALAEAALELAGAGHPVLPLHSVTAAGCSCGHNCGRIGKHPRGVFGLRHASTDPRRVEAWWHGQPRANIGMRCDALLAFDLDGTAGRRSLEQLEWELGELPETRGQTTGRGEHRYYATPAEVLLGNSTAPLGHPAGLDLRGGDRGYVVVAPSLHSSGRPYRWLDPEAPFAPLPTSWLERMLLPKPVELAAVASMDSRSTAYGRAALRKELAALARTREGDRNNALNRSVYSLAGWVSAGELDWYELHESARSVGLQLGLSLDEVERTVRSAMNAGFARPRRKSNPHPTHGQEGWS
jgi:hypothetical protein